MGNPEGLTEKLKPGRRVNRQPSLVTAGTNGPYSWWWDSHRPKNSKWVQENLTDMDLKIKAMLKLIEQDADSFAQRAEMYYKKRPELVHLVEEFYRAYRALAERCDHISGELRQIHHSISEALPNQIQHMLNGDSPGGPEGQMNPDDIEDAREASRLQGLKHLSKILSEYSTIEEKVSELRDELRCVQEENQKMKDTWSSQVDEINNLKGQIQSLTEKNEDLVKQSLEKEASEREKLETAIQSFQDLQGKMDRKEEENRRLEEELLSREEMIKAIEEKVNAAERERDNLQMEMEQIISKMSLLVEELTLMRNQEQKLKERLQEETNQTRNLEVTLTSCQESLNESNEQQKKLTEEIQVGTERLKDADTRVKLLEDEIVRLQTDNQNLMEKISSASSSVKKLEDDVLQLKQERLTLLNEVAFRVDQRNDLQKQLYSSQEEKSSIEQTYQEILKQLGFLGLDSGNLKSSFLGLQEENKKLKELGHKYQDECLEMSKLSKNLEQELLEEKRTFEEAKLLHTDEVKKLNNELERRTVLSQDFQNQNLELVADKDDKTKKIDILEKDLQAYQEQCSSVHTENSKLKNELTSSVALIDCLQEQLDTSKVEKESLQLEITACNTQKSSLEKEVCFLKEEGDHLKGELQEETEKVKSCHVEIGKVQGLVAQLHGRNVTLMEDCENHINEKLMFENRVKELEEELHRKEEERSALMSDLSRELVTSVEQMENLKKLQQLFSIPNLEKKMDGVGAESMYMLNAISEKVSSLQTDILQLQNENDRLSMVESSLNTYLEDLETRMASLQTEKASLSEESEIRHNSLEDSRKEIQALQESAEDLKTELHYSFEREACLERNIEDLKHSLISSQDEQLLLHAQHQKILEDYYALQKKAGELQTEIRIREEESCKHVTVALENHIYGSLLESCVADREAHIKQLMEQMNALVKEKRELENDAQRGEEISQSLKDEVFQLKEVSRLYEEEKQHTIELLENFNALRQKNVDICLKIEANNNLLEQKDNIIVELSHKLQENEEQRSALQNDMQSVEQMHAVSQTEREELHRQLVLLRDDVNHLKEALSVAVDDRASMEKQLQDLEYQKQTVSKDLALAVSREQKLASDLKALSEKEDFTKNQLLIQTEQNKQLELEIEKLYGSLQMKQMENTLLKDGNEKIYDLCKLLATKSREVRGQQEGILKQDINIEDELARTKEVGRSATDMKKVSSDAGAKVSGILEMLLPMKDDVFSLKEEVLGNINSLRNDAQMVQVALEQMQDTKSELSAEAEIRAQEVLRLQAEVDAIQHILIELKRKNQILQDESQRNAKELWNAKARLNNVMSKNINLESQNRSLKAELHLQAQKAFQIQEERNVVESEHNVLSSEVENLKSELKESKDLEGYFLRLFEILLGQHVEVASLDIESCRFAEEKLMRILDELICLRNENAKLKNEALYEYHDYERKNVSGSRAEAMSVLISKSLGNGRANQREFQNKEEDSSGVDLLKNKCSRLEFQVQKLSEKAEMFETKSREAQQMANKLEEVQQTLSDMQPIQLQIQALQTRVRSLKKENTRLRSEMKGELTPSRSFKHREGSFIKEINIGDEDDTPLIQEEKEVVVDESKKIDTRTSETQEIDTLMDDNRKYWNRVSHFTKQTQSLQNSVQELQQKLKSVKSNKKSKGEKWGGVDMNSIEKQLKELNIHVMQLVEHNTRLKKDVKFGFAWANSMHDLNGEEQKLKVDEEVPILCHQNSKIAERLDINTDKARALDMEVQRIRLILSRIPTKPTEEASKMRVPLRAFLVGSKKDQSKRHGCCSCVTPSTIE